MRFYILCLIGMYLNITNSQNLNQFLYLKDTYNNENYLGFAGTLTNLSNSAAPYPKAHNVSDYSFDINYRTINFNKGKRQYVGNYKLLPDMFFLLNKMLKIESNGLRGEGSSITSGIIGWHRWAWNVKVKPKTCYSIGFALNDYFIGNSYRDSGNALVTYDPQGWWLSAGPTFMFHKLLNKHFILHSTINYNIGYHKPINITYALVNKKYPNPHFFHTHAEIVSSIGVFAGVDFSTVINRGNIPSKVRRFDLLLGYKFVL